MDGAAAGDDIDNSRGGVGPVKRTLRPADHFDPFDIIHGEMAEQRSHPAIGIAGIVHPYSVDHDHHEFSG